ncbi:unnamed protein product, partial [Symbiodinium sp. KB8]
AGRAVEEPRAADSLPGGEGGFDEFECGPADINCGDPGEASDGAPGGSLGLANQRRGQRKQRHRRHHFRKDPGLCSREDGSTARGVEWSHG